MLTADPFADCLPVVEGIFAVAEVEVHAGQVRAALEHLDVACSYVVRSHWGQFGRSGQEHSAQVVRTGAQRGAQEIAFDVLTRDFHGVILIPSHVHMGQHRELLENLDVACSRGQHIEYELSGNIPKKCGLVRKEELRNFHTMRAYPQC